MSFRLKSSRRKTPSSSLFKSSRRRKRRDYGDRQPPSIAFRAGMLGAMALLLFGVLIFRIWFLEVISGNQYVAMAKDNFIRFVPDEAPRGIIYDRNGKPLVENRAGLAVTVLPAALKEPQRELAELSKIIKVPEADIQQKLDQHKNDTYSSIVVKKDITPAMKSYLIERIPLYFPGVDIKTFPLRSYPNGQEAAHVLGHVGQIDQQELAEPRYKGYKDDAEIGKDGVEYEYDKWLRGVDGGMQLEVDASGRPKTDASGQPVELSSQKAVPGNDVYLSIDSNIQTATEAALQYGVNLAHQKNYPATGGAAIVMDPKNGQILGMASNPTFDPSFWVGGMSTAKYQELTEPSAHDPLLNRAIQGQYPPGSTFKAITALAGLQEGLINPAATVDSTGSWHVPGDPSVIFHDWAPLGIVDLHRAIVMSCDTYFYDVGYRFYKDNNNQGIQKWARIMGLGKPTGVDLPGEAAGRIPDPAWKQQVGQTPIDKMWMPGNSVNMAIGQGDVLVTPLQMAAVYCAIANGGTLVRPHVGLRVVDPVTHQMLQDLEPPLGPSAGLNPENLAMVKSALIGAAQPGSAIGSVFAGFQPTIAGKSGTAQVAGKADYGWYVAYAPADNPQYVVLAMIEQGGGGSASGAPTVKKILESLFHTGQAAPGQPSSGQPASPANG